MKHFFQGKKVRVFLPFFYALLVIAGLTGIIFAKRISSIKTKNVSAGYQSPQIYINGGENSYSSAGLITLASTDEPAVSVSGYNITGIAEITLYKADLPSLLNYLTHDKNNKQTKTAPDVNSFQFI